MQGQRRTSNANAFSAPSLSDDLGIDSGVGTANVVLPCESKRDARLAAERKQMFQNVLPEYFIFYRDLGTCVCPSSAWVTDARWGHRLQYVDSLPPY
jgi:hypothetical protein